MNRIINPRKSGGSNLIVVIFLILTLLASRGARVSAAPAAAPAPIEIQNCNQLQAMKNNLMGHFVLANSIDCSTTVGWNAGQGFEPVGDSTNNFDGILEGKGHVIVGLFIDRSADWNIGLFGYTGSGAEIRDVHLEGVNVSGKQQVGGLVGANQGTITRSSSAGSVSAAMGAVGGLVGYNTATIEGSYSSAIVGGSVDIYYAGGLVGENRGSVSQSYSSSSVTGEEGIGGLAGTNISGTISQCYATGTVNGGNGTSGGLVGSNQYNNAAIIDSYATGTVNGGTGAYASAGGLLGSNGGTGWATETVDSSYAVGKVSGDKSGGLVGSNANDASTISDSYWDQQSSGIFSSDGGTARNTAPMFQGSNYVGWDFGSIWSIDNGRIYPWHQWQPPTFSDLVTCEGSGQQTYLWTSSDAWGVVRQCTLEVPASGQVFISADATIAYHNGEYEALAGIGIDTPEGDYNTDRWVSVYDHGPGGSSNSLALSTIKPLGAGTHTIYLVVKRYTGSPGTAVKILDSTLSVVFVPTPDADILLCEDSGHNTWLTGSTNFSVVRQCTLNLPTHGWVYISADGTADWFDADYEAQFRLGIDSTEGDLRIDRWVDVQDDASGDTDTTVTISGLLPVAAGEHTVYLLGKRYAGAGTVELYDSTLNVLFLPAPSVTTASCNVVNNQTLDITANVFSVIRQCSIDVPEDSQVFISANSSLASSIADMTAHFQISIDNSSSGDSNADRFVDLYPGPFNENDKGMALTMLRQVNSGNHTFYLLGKRDNGTGNARIFDSTLSVLVLRKPPEPVKPEIFLPLAVK